MKCDYDKTDIGTDPIDPELFDSNECQNTINFATKEACPTFNFFIIASFLERYKIIFGIVLIILGLFLTFVGAKLAAITVFIATTLGVIICTFILMFQFILPGGTAQFVVWIVLGIGLVAGIGIGFIAGKYSKAVLGFIIGGLTGYLLGMVIYTSATVHISGNAYVSLTYIKSKGNLLVNYLYHDCRMYGFSFFRKKAYCYSRNIICWWLWSSKSKFFKNFKIRVFLYLQEVSQVKVYS